jgi:hypothetical protein
MKDSDLRFNILTAAALGVVVSLAPGTGRAADEASGLYIGAGVGQSDVDTICGVSGAVTTGCARRTRRGGLTSATSSTSGSA